MRVHGSEVRSRWVGRATWYEPIRDVGIIIDPVANIRGRKKKEVFWLIQPVEHVPSSFRSGYCFHSFSSSLHL